MNWVRLSSSDRSSSTSSCGSSTRLRPSSVPRIKKMKTKMGRQQTAVTPTSPAKQEAFMMKDDLSVDTTLSSELSKIGIEGNGTMSRRRNVVLVRDRLDESFGFALQSYVFRRSLSGAVERLTYVDYVRDHSPASRAGVRRGDVLVAINGSSVVGESHSALVTLIQSQLTMRVVLLFQNIAKIVSLTARSMQLQYVLAEKQRMLEELEAEEQRILGSYAPESLCDIDEWTTTDSATSSGSSLPTMSSYGGFSSPVTGSDLVSRLDIELISEDQIRTQEVCIDVREIKEKQIIKPHIIRVDSQVSIEPQVTRL